MAKSMDVLELLESLEAGARASESIDGILNKASAAAQAVDELASGGRSPAGADSSSSLFSQLLERIVQGYALKVVDDSEEARASLEILLDGVPDSVLIMSLSGAIREANQAFFSGFGYDRAELVGRSIYELLPEAYRGAFHERLAAFAIGGARQLAAPIAADDVLAFRGLKRDGSVVSMDCLLSAIQLRGEPAVIALIRDLSFDQELIRQLKESKEHYVALSETITEAIFRLDVNFSVIFANSGVLNTFGWERHEVVGQPFSMLFPPEVFAKHADEFRKYFYVDDRDRLALGMKRTFEFLGSTKHRGVTPMEMSFGNSKDCLGRTLTCVIRDISQRKTLERKLRHLAFHDKLTGLGNRDLFMQEITLTARRLADVPEARAVVLFLDLDGFKRVNDTIGHDAGDQLLVETAKRLRVCIRDEDSAYRFGGDEFVLLLSEVRDAADGVLVAERILKSVAEPYLLRSKLKASGSRVNVGVSIGVAVMPDHGSSVEEAIKSADIAMYCSKEEGKNRYTVYDPAVSAKAKERWQLEQELKGALGAGGFKLFYQPIVGSDGRVRGMEALTRWTRADGSMVPPSVFIPLAEENGMITAIGDWALRRACYDAKRLEATAGRGVYVSINVSGRQFERPGFADELEAIVRASGLPPRLLKLELTESTLMHDTKDAAERIHDIKRRLPGVSFMIDDFGTGYSSLSYLSRLPIDALKIDISFVLNLAERQNQKVVNAIINLGHSLQLDIVAEGIETEQQWQYFARRECGALQGFYFHKPAPLANVYRYIAAQPALQIEAAHAAAPPAQPAQPASAGAAEASVVL